MGPCVANRQSPLGLFPAQPTPRSYERVVEVLRTGHYCRRSEQTYESGYDIRAAQELLGHGEVKSTMLNIHALNRGSAGVCGHVDGLAEHRGGYYIRITRQDKSGRGAQVTEAEQIIEP